MSEHSPTKLPLVQDLIASHDEEGETYGWKMAFNMASLRQYFAAWQGWFMANRSFVQSEECRPIRQEAFDAYRGIVGKYMPWFQHAAGIVRDCDPEMQKPILSLYFVAKIEVLASLKIYQDELSKLDESTMVLEVREWMEGKRDNPETYEPRKILLFTTFANAYEHVFTYLFRMIGQFHDQFGRLPEKEEFDQLIPQFIRYLHQEAMLSRKENGILETYFSENDDPFYSIEKKDGEFILTVNYPSGRRRQEIESFLDRVMSPEELFMRERRDLSVHYGCPAAFSRSNGVSTLSFVVNDVITAVSKAMWPPADFDVNRYVQLEKVFRQDLALPKLNVA